MIDDDYALKILECDMGHSIAALWDWSKAYPPFDGNLEKAKEGFFYLAKKFMQEDVLKLGHEGKLLDGTIEDQLKLFMDAWPSEYDANVEEKDIDNMWWLLFAPAGAVWVYPDGFQEWT